MTIPVIQSVGFCVNYSEQGNWAFELALDLARRKGLQLNVFHFLSDPYEEEEAVPPGLSRDQRAQRTIAMERKMRLYYDDRLGDYLDVGFRLCEDNEWVELHRCLTKQEFQLLVLAYPRTGATFGKKPLERFADGFVCPVILVGPDSPRQLRLNSPAQIMSYRLGLDQDVCTPIDSQEKEQAAPTS